MFINENNIFPLTLDIIITTTTEECQYEPVFAIITTTGVIYHWPDRLFLGSKIFYSKVNQTLPLFKKVI